ncbi:MAG: DEAD/DEAH box helicase [Candidatus Korarchaeota archaeon]
MSFSLPEQLKLALEEAGITSPSPIQKMAWAKIYEGKNALLVAPTGSGKTEAAMVPIIARLMERNRETESPGVKVIYVTPLRALNRDMFSRLNNICSRVGLTVGIRHGDTSKQERTRQITHPPDILITTPETLYIMLLNKRTKDIIRTVEWIVLDELHELYPSKRGSHLIAVLTILNHILRSPARRIGLSATVSDPEAIAKYFLGEAEVFVAGNVRDISVDVVRVNPDSNDLSLSKDGIFPLWAAVVRYLKSIISNYKSTLLFVNTRSVAEQLSHAAKILHPDMLIEAHHGSLSQDVRIASEQMLKNGMLNGLIATSSMELGIDIGHINYVIQIASPRQAVHLTQRIGRSCHRIGEQARGAILALSDADYYESLAIVERAKKGNFESSSPPNKPLDVLAFMTVAVLFIYDEWGRRGVDPRVVFSILRSGPPFTDISYEEFESVLEYLNSERIIRFDGMIIRRSRRSIEFKKGHFSTITSFRQYRLINARNNDIVGNLDERFVLSRDLIGKKVVLGGKTWKILDIYQDGTVQAVETERGVDIIPSWIGEEIPVEEETSILAAKLWHEADPSVPPESCISIEGDLSTLVVVWCPHGTRINSVISAYLETELNEMGIKVYTQCDGFRIGIIPLIRMDPTEKNIHYIQTLIKRLFQEEVTYDDLKKCVKNHSLYDWFFAKVAQRFGIIDSDESVTYNDIAKIRRLHDKGVLSEETMKEIIHEQLDLEGALRLFNSVRKGDIEIHASEKYSPPSTEYLFLITRMVVPSTENSMVEHYKEYVFNKEVRLTCSRCGNSYVSKIKELPSKIICDCGSRLIIVSPRNDDTPSQIIKKWRTQKSLTDAEKSIIKRYFQTAPLILNYGKKAIFALAVYGIGPVAATKILSKFPPNSDIDGEFIRMLMNAQENFIRTRQYWK